VARVFFERALQIEPDNADALAGDASTYLIERSFFPPNPQTVYDEKILGQTDRAIALDPNTDTSFSVKSQYLATSLRPDEALRAADDGIANNPNSADLYASRGLAEAFLGRFEQARSDVERAFRLSPRDPFLRLWHFFLCDAELGLKHLDAAVKECQKAIDLGYRAYPVHRNLAAIFALQGNADEAKSALSEARRLYPPLTVKFTIARSPIPALLEGLRKAGLPEE
jgi:tetratricopeptide (TPR) repeat protein